MSNIIHVIPEATGDEALYLNKITEGLSVEQLNRFSNAYRARRKDPQVILLTCLLGFFSIAGIHRFLLNQIGMGILYLLTGGLCLIGTIVDLVNHKDLAFQYNREVAKELRSMM
ncbi:MAG: TM2 domain-containing protein [Balneolaceae bacterium]|nr:TM2 domain-containing protein [Balneolaceae bacterium]